MMPSNQPFDDADRDARKVVVRSERSELLAHLQAILEPLMVGLGLVFLVLLLVDFAGPDLSERGQTWVDRAVTAIWVAFLFDFAVRFVVAPSKGEFLRANWLGALSLALPFLRPLRILRVARAARSISLMRLLGGTNRGIRVLRQITRGRQVVYVATLTCFVVLAGAVGVLYFDRDIDGAPIQTFGDALWWSAALVTTINGGTDAVSPEARVVAILMRVYAVSVFGLVTASIASYLIGTAGGSPSTAEDDEFRADIVALRRELADVRLTLTSRHLPTAVGDEVPPTSSPTVAPPLSTGRNAADHP